MSYQDSTTTVEQRSSRRRLAGGAERGAPMSQSAYSRLRGASTAKPPVAVERVTPHGRPDAAQGVQPGLRGLDGETLSCAGLCGGRTRSKSNGCPTCDKIYFSETALPLQSTSSPLRGASSPIFQCLGVTSKGRPLME